MLLLTPRERKVLIFIGCLIIAGSLLKFRSKTVASEQKPVAQEVFININIASEKELEKIPGIGPVMAQRIVQHRFKNGSFRTIEDLKKVKGIGDKKAAVIASHIRF